MLSAASNLTQFGGVSLQLCRSIAPYAATVLRSLEARRSSNSAATQLHPALFDYEAPPFPFSYFSGGLAHYWHRRQKFPGAVCSENMGSGLSPKERAMVRLFMAGCLHHWDDLPDAAREYMAAGCSAEELRGCVRHLAVFAGYPLCLAATLALQKEKLLPEDTPAKCGGPPGNAFELVYANMTDAVRSKMRAADPALGEWIRVHLYGDLYSSPGLDLRQKQLLACAFLGQVGMPQQLLGHCIAALRFGASRDELEEAMRLGVEAAPALSAHDREEAFLMLDKAYAKYQKDFSDQHEPPSVTVPDPQSIRIPTAAPPLP